jgi:hypothetical protein
VTWRACVVGLVLLAAVAGPVPVVAAASASRASVGFEPVPAGSASAPQATWATTLSGRSDGHFDRFWQLFVDAGSTGRWVLATPPGVATNGGLAVAGNATGSELLAGFGPSQYLTFSPLAFSSSSGQRWSPGGLTSPLDTPEPSALAFGGGGDALAISGRTVLVEHGSLTSWKPLVTGAALQRDRATRPCDVGAIEAVGFDRTAAPIVATSCRRPGRVGVFTVSGGRWSPVPIETPPSLGTAAIDVVRLSGSSALFAGDSHAVTSVFAAWPTAAAGATWSTSGPLRIVGRAIASGTGAGRSVFVVTEVGQVEHAAIVAGPGRPWRALPVLPHGTTTIAVTPSGTTEALVVVGSRFSAWRLGENGRSWTKFQSLTIPIVYGSSD